MKLKQPIFLFTIGAAATLGGCSNSEFQRGSPAISRPPIECAKREKLQGLNFMVVVDNSSSQSDNDCPGKKFSGIDKETGGRKFQCASAPEREKAINNGFEFLSSYAIDHPGFESNFSVITFPSQKFTNSGYDLRTGSSEGKGTGWVNAVGENSTLVETAATAATRTPFGLTPFLGAIEGIKEVFTNLSSDNKLAKIVFFITDGFPTDENAKDVKEKARLLRKSIEEGGSAVDRVITLQVGLGSNKAEIDATKKNAARIMKASALFGGLERSQDNVDELLGMGPYAKEGGLVEAISDSFLPKNSPTEIKTVFQDQIQRAVECQ